MKNQMVYSGQRVVAADGRVYTVAYLSPKGDVYAWNGRGGVTAIVVKHDAWGGEADQWATNAGEYALAA